jgi:hypothetical protein
MTRSTVAVRTRCPVGVGDADAGLVGGVAEVDVGAAAGEPPDDTLQAEQTRTSNAAAVLAMGGLIPRASMAKGQIATARVKPCADR